MMNMKIGRGIKQMQTDKLIEIINNIKNYANSCKGIAFSDNTKDFEEIVDMAEEALNIINAE